MDDNINELVEKFHLIKKMGWIKSVSVGTGGIGRTFEHLLGKEENFEIPDYNGIEIKTRRACSKYSISLFNARPDGNYFHEIERLKDYYGYPDKTFINCKILNVSLFCTKFTYTRNGFIFRLKVNRSSKKVILFIYDKNWKLLENFVYWDFDILDEKLNRKLKFLAYINANRKFLNSIEYFQYYSIELFYLKDFNVFLELLEKGIIEIKLEIGVFKSGRRKGQIHDHGTTFCIREYDLLKLYTKY